MKAPKTEIMFDYKQVICQKADKVTVSHDRAGGLVVVGGVSLAARSRLLNICVTEERRETPGVH